MTTTLNDGTYKIDVMLVGEPGEVYLTSPTTLTISGGNMKMRLEWNGAEYEYMSVAGLKYPLVGGEKKSCFDVNVYDINLAISAEMKRVGAAEGETETHLIAIKPESIAPVGFTPITWAFIGMVAVVACAAIIPTVLYSIRKKKEQKAAAEAEEAAKSKKKKR